MTETEYADSGVRYGTPAGRWVLFATVLGSGVAALDATVVNVALPQIGAELGANVSGLQWTLNGYLLTLAALILLGGSLGDRYGRRRVFVIGVIWFAVASALCGAAVNVPMLVAARALQGIGGALLTPGSLAILQASFVPEDRSRAIGAWSGLGGVAAAVGPLLGGVLVDAASWRWVFLLNLPLAALVVAVASRHVPETTDPTAEGRHMDIAGSVLAAVGLAGVTYALIEAPERGATSPLILAAAVAGLASLAGFVMVERRSSHPMLPLDIFASRQFTAANLVTFAVYGAMSGTFFLLVVHLQQVVGFTPLQAGAATLPITMLMLVLSARAGQVAQRIGPRVPMTVGPLLLATGLLMMARVGPGSGYVSDILPAVLLFGSGLVVTVAPLTAAVLAAADARHAGIASGVNNAVARAAGLLAVAIIPVLAGLTGDAYEEPAVFAAGFIRATLISAVLAAVGGVLAWLTISNDLAAPAAPKPEHHCAIAGPPLRPSPTHR
ncbi:MAG: DHA2 family efflux MFS transporter permease subunit [Egibacteraceae bacterium]